MRFTNESFIEKCKSIHGNIYDYSLLNYNGSKKRIKIICKKCNEIFETRADYFSSGKGCPYCYSNRYNTKKFIEESNKIHNNKYRYNNSKFISMETKTEIVCPKHGVFKQTPHSHLSGNGCPKCQYELTGDRCRKTTEQFIKEAKIIHGNNYNYEPTVYINQKTKITIKCNKCLKLFEQLPSNHLKGEGCTYCYGKIKSNTKDFINKSKLIHGDKYDYSLVNYINCYDKVKIICPKHGIFEQSPTKHINNQGCPKCHFSKGEIIIENYLKNNKITFETQKRFNDCRGINNTLPFDFYIPSKNILIEFQGIQHYKPVERFGGKDRFIEQQKLDKIKKDYAIKNKYNFIEINYKQINKIPQILDKFLTTNKINGMKTELSTENADVKVYISVENKTDIGYESMNRIADKLISLATELCGTEVEEDGVILG